MSTTKVSQAVARPARTAVQMVPSAVVTEFIDAFVHNLSDKQYAALAALLLLVFGYVQVLVENGIGKGFLRTVPGRHVATVEGPGK